MVNYTNCQYFDCVKVVLFRSVSMNLYMVATYSLLFLSVFLVLIIYFLLNSIKSKSASKASCFVELLNYVKQNSNTINKRTQIFSKYRHDINGALQVVTFGTSMLKRVITKGDEDRVPSLIDQINNAVIKISDISDFAKSEDQKLLRKAVTLSLAIQESRDLRNSSINYKLLKDNDFTITISNYVEFLIIESIGTVLEDISCATHNQEIYISADVEDNHVVIKFSAQLDSSSLKKLNSKYKKITEELDFFKMKLFFEGSDVKIAICDILETSTPVENAF